MDVQQLFTVLKKEAECPLCLETVNNPKTLPCIHSFCLECLDKHANFARRQLQATIKCPVCQTSFQIPEGDSFKNLPASYHLNRLVDVLALKDGGTQAQKCSSCDENNTASSYCFVCQIFLCTACFEAHQRLKTTRGHRNVVIEKLNVQDVQELIHRPTSSPGLFPQKMGGAGPTHFLREKPWGRGCSQTCRVFTAISRKSTAGILLRRMQSSYLPQM